MTFLTTFSIVWLWLRLSSADSVSLTQSTRLIHLDCQSGWTELASLNSQEIFVSSWALSHLFWQCRWAAISSVDLAALGAPVLAPWLWCSKTLSSHRTESTRWHCPGSARCRIASPLSWSDSRSDRWHRKERKRRARSKPFSPALQTRSVDEQMAIHKLVWDCASIVSGIRSRNLRPSFNLQN